MNKDNKNSVSGFSHSHQTAGVPWHLHLSLCCIGLFIIFTTAYGFYIGNHMVEKYTPLIDAAMEIKLEATTAHLWFEEIISGDRYEDIEAVHKHITQAQWYATAMLEGGKNPEGTFVALKDPVLRSEIEKIFEKIAIFRKITEQRYESGQESGIGSLNDQRYDAIFRDFINQADRVESTLQAKITSEKRIYNLIQVTVIGVNFILLAAVIVFFHRFERARFSDMQLINTTNENLQKALLEIKTLQGIIPICSYCKKIQDEKGLWNQLELYIHSHSDAKFSHSACPDCYSQQITQLTADIRNNQADGD